MRTRSLIIAATLTAGLALAPVVQAQASTPGSPPTPAQAGLEAHIARDIKVLDDVRSLSHDPMIPAEQRRGYGASIAAVIHLRSTTYSKANILAQPSSAAVTALANRWKPYHQEIIDLRSAVQLADDSSGGYADPTSSDFASLLTTLQKQLQVVAAKGTDVTVATAALARIPADTLAVDAQAEPYFTRLAHADFKRHALVTQEINQCHTVITTGSAVVAFDNDFLLVFNTAFPGLLTTAHGQTPAHFR